MEKVLEVGTPIRKNGSIFIVTHINEKYYRAEQYIDNKLQSYEVGKLRKMKEAFGNKPEYDLSIPSTGQFGLNCIDRNYPKRMKEESIKYFNSLT